PPFRAEPKLLVAIPVHVIDVVVCQYPIRIGCLLEMALVPGLRILVKHTGAIGAHPKRSRLVFMDALDMPVKKRQRGKGIRLRLVLEKPVPGAYEDIAVFPPVKGNDEVAGE